MDVCHARGDRTMTERHILNDEDIIILNRVKEDIKEAVEQLKGRNIRSVNIELELHCYIKSLLKPE